MEIRATRSQIQVALNGKLINQLDLTQVQIPARMAANAARPSGYIGLQCNNTDAAFRNIRIRPEARVTEVANQLGVIQSMARINNSQRRSLTRVTRAGPKALQLFKHQKLQR